MTDPPPSYLGGLPGLPGRVGRGRALYWPQLCAGTRRQSGQLSGGRPRVHTCAAGTAGQVAPVRLAADGAEDEGTCAPSGQKEEVSDVSGQLGRTDKFCFGYWLYIFNFVTIRFFCTVVDKRTVLTLKIQRLKFDFLEVW